MPCILYMILAATACMALTKRFNDNKNTEKNLLASNRDGTRRLNLLASNRGGTRRLNATTARNLLVFHQKNNKAIAAPSKKGQPLNPLHAECPADTHDMMTFEVLKKDFTTADEPSQSGAHWWRDHIKIIAAAKRARIENGAPDPSEWNIRGCCLDGGVDAVKEATKMDSLSSRYGINVDASKKPIDEETARISETEAGGKRDAEGNNIIPVEKRVFYCKAYLVKGLGSECGCDNAMLGGGWRSPEQWQHTHLMEKETKFDNEIIGNVLTWAKIEEFTYQTMVNEVIRAASSLKKAMADRESLAATEVNCWINLPQRNGNKLRPEAILRSERCVKRAQETYNAAKATRSQAAAAKSQATLDHKLKELAGAERFIARLTRNHYQPTDLKLASEPVDG